MPSEKLSCIQVTRPENFGSQFGNLVNAIECDIPIAQEQWNDFFTNPTILFGALAGIGTAVAVIVALMQSASAKKTAEGALSDAIKVAEEADKLALKREVRVKELDRYEALWELAAHYASSPRNRKETHDEASTNLAFGMRKYLMYLSITAPDLVQPFGGVIHKLQQAINVAHEYWVPLRLPAEFRKRHPELGEWFDQHPNIDSDFVDMAGKVMNILPTYYDGTQNMEETVSTLKVAEEVIEHRYKPLIERYKSSDQTFENEA